MLQFLYFIIYSLRSVFPFGSWEPWFSSDEIRFVFCQLIFLMRLAIIIIIIIIMEDSRWEIAFSVNQSLGISLDSTSSSFPRTGAVQKPTTTIDVVSLGRKP